jgi:hypothetical protein
LCYDEERRPCSYTYLSVSPPLSDSPRLCSLTPERYGQKVKCISNHKWTRGSGRLRSLRRSVVTSATPRPQLMASGVISAIIERYCWTFVHETNTAERSGYPRIPQSGRHRYTGVGEDVHRERDEMKKQTNTRGSLRVPTAVVNLTWESAVASKASPWMARSIL